MFEQAYCRCGQVIDVGSIKRLSTLNGYGVAFINRRVTSMQSSCVPQRFTADSGTPFGISLVLSATSSTCQADTCSLVWHACLENSCTSTHSWDSVTQHYSVVHSWETGDRTSCCINSTWVFLLSLATKYRLRTALMMWLSRISMSD